MAASKNLNKLMEMSYRIKTGSTGNRALLYALCLIITAFTLGSCATQVKPGGYKTNGFWYTFKSGDSLDAIGKKYNISRLELQRVNEIYDTDDLSEGIEIFIPQKDSIPEKVAGVDTQTRDGFKMVWPAAGTISSGFGKRRGTYHQGIDITKDNGREIKAAANGVVEFAGVKSGYGNTIIIDHGSGTKTLYAHNAKLYVKKGQRVRQGIVIALMGSTGKSNGIHLHFEVRKNGEPQNPLRYLPIR